MEKCSQCIDGKIHPGLPIAEVTKQFLPDCEHCKGTGIYNPGIEFAQLEADTEPAPFVEPVFDPINTDGP